MSLFYFAKDIIPYPLTVVGFKRLLFQVDKEIFQCFADVSIGKYIHVIFLESLDVFVFFRTPAGEDDE